MTRIPPVDVQRILRKEVGFGCPVNDCGNPYLSWHHFDPPWKEQKHHNPEGMIALCGEHHPKADACAFTKEQLRSLKKTGFTKEAVSGRFDWLRRQLLVIVGGNYYHETPIAVRYKNSPVVWFERDEQDHILLNVKMITASSEERIEISHGFWVAKGNPTDFSCPPSGKLIEARYKNGDFLKIEFFEFLDEKKLLKNHPALPQGFLPIPLTTVEIHMKAPELGIEFGPTKSKIPGIIMQGNFASRCGVGLDIGHQSVGFGKTH